MGTAIKIFLSYLILSTLITSAFGNSNFRCPISSEGKSLIKEAVIRNTLDTKWILSQSHQGEVFQNRGFARNLIGWTNSFLGSLTLAEKCEGPRTFDKFCEPACEQETCGIERCSQLGCESAGVDTLKLWWQQSPVNYTTDQSYIPKFHITYLTIPITNIRYDGRISGNLFIDWKSDDHVKARSHRNGNHLNASSSLRATGTTTETGPQEGHVEILYPSLSRLKGNTHVQLDFDSHGTVTGKVHFKDTTIGRIVEGNNGLARVIWLGVCAL